MILTPEYIFKTIECIHPDFLAAHGIKALVLDVDNTLTADNSQVLEHTVQAWLDEMRAAGIRLTIVSNNTAKRVRPFADVSLMGCAFLILVVVSRLWAAPDSMLLQGQLAVLLACLFARTIKRGRQMHLVGDGKGR